ncbi:hypothetical protein E1B28_012947 [Marasmius oreades]|uniref:Uncharacterized protein n=1 Tax=Marasmius oreades TaxID=181124 RepID=A0A9P7UPH2_9AGAR|nr:uncharacterized protein E1B28_012947 [Marasmius oreades]KAG7089000.1 hypothetical protein E1B28_012947 [Marasmius oreades]
MDKLFLDVKQGLLAKDLYRILQGLEAIVQLSQLFKISDLKAYWNGASSKDSLNDRYLLLEKILVLMSRLGDTKEKSEKLRKLGEDIERFVIDTLYKDLPHPPSTYLDTSYNLNTSQQLPVTTYGSGAVKYAFRTSDGSGYNPLFPSIGKAGTPYARSVTSTNLLPVSSLPDSGLVFDTLLKRDKFVEHPGGVSSLFFAFADLVIHSIFNTDPRDLAINNASSYLDLSILYGSSDEDVRRVRRTDGTGSLWDDVFSDRRLLRMPPASCALLILFSRNHNYIANKILSINEFRGYKNPLELNEKERKSQDDEIFNRARLVNSAYFVQVILGDYVGAILGQVRDGQDWRLNPLVEMRQVNHELAPRGEGNAVSIEFNLLYRWHATLSREDEGWTEAMLQKYLGQDADLSTVTPTQFYVAAVKALQYPDDPREWTFNGLERVDGRFKDEDLANLILNATERRAGAFKARGIPEALRVVEILGIEHARTWGTCSLNEFRKFMNLKPYKNFEQWNGDKTVAAAARSLYKHIDNLELYVGLQAEESKTPGPGAGLCPGYTISRAILADAVSLTHCQFQKSDGSYGGMLTKLLFRTLSDHYKPRSAYAHFPFLDPSYMRQQTEERDMKNGTNDASKYTWTRPSTAVSTPKMVHQYDVVQQILASKEFMTASGERLETILGHRPPDLSFIQNQLLQHREKWASYFLALTDDLIVNRSFDHVGSGVRSVDIVKDVLNILPVKWICQRIAGLPISRDQGRRNYDEEKYCKEFQDICQYVFVNLDSYKDWELRENAISIYKRIHGEIVKDLKGFGSWIKDTVNKITDPCDPEDRSREFLFQLYQTRGTTGLSALADAIFCEVVPTAAHFSQAVAHVINYFLNEEKKEARDDIVKLSKLRTADSTAKIIEHIYESLAYDSPIPVTSLTALKDSKLGDHRINAGEQVFVNLSRNDGLDVEHPHLGLGTHGLLLPPLFEAIAPGVVAAILGLPNLQRAHGESGKFNRYSEEYRGLPLQQYITYEGRVSPFPDSLVVQYTRV